MIKCLFYECRNAVEAGSAKCIFHRNRSQCNAPHCRNQAYARGRCVRHGARKSCLLEGCTHYRRAGGYCARHTTAIRKHGHVLNQINDAVEQGCSLEPLEFVCTSSPTPWKLDWADWAMVRDLLRDDDATGSVWTPATTKTATGHHQHDTNVVEHATWIRV
ncbi:hypothetical protein H310_09682 [Aphanomyces invadans]|uniref:Uncharacterized protein n=1 Tax=Aphanomyces invadans TaxID=157072 RepID=A0A024TT81_9STRA|nr:hypothetical protein H310_09682 [Aphanomyces invadans]ETV97345.1 hypothetical protein H310_09682 [Aphanomyces invadans]|eukprot:XP_008874053.1 hypothetical protein H310_09682 [Aphanomyces invadans]